jgi:hypothetical protein
MDRFKFGPRDNSIIQVAYSVADIQEEMRRYTELLHIGPWFLVGPLCRRKGYTAARRRPCRSVSHSPIAANS